MLNANCQKSLGRLSLKEEGWHCSSVEEHLPQMHNALGSILSAGGGRREGERGCVVMIKTPRTLSLCSLPCCDDCGSNGFTAINE